MWNTHIYINIYRYQSPSCVWTLVHLFYLEANQYMWHIHWKSDLPVHPVVPFLTEYPTWQWQMKEPLVFSHSPNMQMLEFKSHSFTSIGEYKLIVSWTLLSFLNTLFFRWKYLLYEAFIFLNHNIFQLFHPINSLKQLRINVVQIPLFGGKTNTSCFHIFLNAI